LTLSAGVVRRHRLTISIAIAVVLLICGLQTSAGTSVLDGLGLRSPTATFVELSFADPAHLPPVRDPAGQVDVVFSLRSHGEDPRDVTWRVETSGGGGTRLQSSGTVTLQPGRAARVTRAVNVPCPSARASAARAMVRVRLVDPAEDILTWVACPSRAS
jgi:hypothetical protein